MRDGRADDAGDAWRTKDVARTLNAAYAAAAPGDTVELAVGSYPRQQIRDGGERPRPPPDVWPRASREATGSRTTSRSRAARWAPPRATRAGSAPRRPTATHSPVDLDLEARRRSTTGIRRRLPPRTSTGTSVQPGAAPTQGPTRSRPQPIPGPVGSLSSNAGGTSKAAGWSPSPGSGPGTDPAPAKLAIGLPLGGSGHVVRRNAVRLRVGPLSVGRHRHAGSPYFTTLHRSPGLDASRAARGDGRAHAPGEAAIDDPGADRRGRPEDPRAARPHPGEGPAALLGERRASAFGRPLLRAARERPTERPSGIGC